MLAVYILAEGAGDTGRSWLVWVALVVFFLMVLLGWLAWSKGWLKQDEEESAPAHGHGHDDAHGHAAEAHPSQADDLTSIEGIGPKVAKLLAGIGITTFASLAEADLDKLREVLDESGYKYMEPSGWVEQAKLAAAGDSQGLQKLQDELKGGRRAG
jgi:predicted flap endonuclease-1-like 5' DNA nuclease